jgi:Xaa-Pro aminopeptidase
VTARGAPPPGGTGPLEGPEPLGPLGAFEPFGPLDHRGRLARCQDALEAEGLDALVVTKLANIRYLSGFTGSAAVLVVRRRSALFVTDGRYDEQGRGQLGAAGVEADIAVAVDQRPAVTAATAGCHRIGLEAAWVSWANQRRYAEEWFADAELVPTQDLVEAWRVVKEPAEVARIEAAATVADAALDRCLPLLAERPTEAQFALELDAAMRRAGSEAAAFETIVAGGPNSARPHHHPSERVLGEGDLVVLDFGATVDGYRSDMTRTVCLGAPTPAQRLLYEVVGEAQAAGRAAVGPDVPAREVDAAARRVIEAAGWGEQFPHGTGHGVGLDIHEAPHVARTSAATLARSSVVTVEPGVYLPGVGGVRTEDTVVISPDGARALTKFPKSLTF